MNLADRFAERWRRNILLALAEDSAYRLSEQSLAVVLDYFGPRASLDQVRAEIAWLEAQRLVRVERLANPRGGDLLVAALLPAGQEVAEGRRFPGVARLEPG